MKWIASFVMFVALVSMTNTSYARSQWKEYGGEGGRKFSKLRQINTKNVDQLELAFKVRTRKGSDNNQSPVWAALQVTPLMVGGLMYICNTQGHVLAVHPQTGDEIWRFDDGPMPYEGICRGVSYWKDRQAKRKSPCKSRIYYTRWDGRLYSLDAKTGKKCSGFGDTNGYVDLKKDLGDQFFDIPTKKLLEVFYTSAPLIYDHKGTQVTVIGGSVLDNLRIHPPSGVVRAFDLKTGALVWSWVPLPDWATPIEPGPGRGIYALGTPNVWTTLNASKRAEMVYLPMGNASPDFFHGADKVRAGTTAYSSALVALDIKTGQPKWHFNTVNNDVWDYDLPSQPAFVRLKNSKGRKVHALSVPTKMGHVFFLDEKTGEPVFPVEMRSVETKNDVGEVLASQQPFPTFPKGLNEGLEPRLTDEWREVLRNFSPDALAHCEKVFNEFRNEGVFTPNTSQGAIQSPSLAGGNHWGGVSIDPRSKLMVTTINTRGNAVKLHTGDTCLPENLAKNGFIPMLGSPYCIEAKAFIYANDTGGTIECGAPPYGQILAIDLKKKKEVWRKSFGTITFGTKDARNFNVTVEGSPNIAGTLQTAGNLVFVGASLDEKIRAFHRKTGEELWSFDLPAMAAASPMTYKYKGVQYVAIAAGGHNLMDPSGSLGGDIFVFKLRSK